MKNKRKKIFNALFVISCFLITIYYIFHGKNINKIIEYIEKANFLYWIICILLVLFYIISESVIIHYLLGTFNQKVNFISCCFYSFIGFFFSCITPSATGGQPAQIVFMKKDNISVHISTIALLVITISYKLVLIFYGGIILLFKPTIIMQQLENVMGWVYIGFYTNIVMVVFMAMLIICPTVTESAVNGLFRLIAKITKSSKVEILRLKTEKTMENFVVKSNYIITHKLAMIKVFIITFVQRTSLFFITYLVCISFGKYDVSVINITVLQAMISVAVDIIPLPGGMGITEYLFLTIFEPILNKDLTTPIMIISRGISYYTQLIISAFFTAVAYIKFYAKDILKERREL